MKIAYIAPPRVTAEVSAMGTCVMGLAHLILAHFVLEGTGTGLEYSDALLSLSMMGKRPVIVDNSLMELNEALSVEDLLSAAGRVVANEVVLPDSFMDAAGTLTLLEVASKDHLSALLGANHKWGLKYMAVPQGRDLEEWIDCYSRIRERYVEGGLVHTIGIPKVVATFEDTRFTEGLPYWCGRIELLGMLEKSLSEAERGTHAWHLLGVWHNMEEVVEIARRYPWVRSCDTSLLVYQALAQTPIPVPAPPPMLAATPVRPAGRFHRPASWDRIGFEDYPRETWEKILTNCFKYRRELECLESQS